MKMDYHAVSAWQTNRVLPQDVVTSLFAGNARVVLGKVKIRDVRTVEEHGSD
jgi:hypothetical protein